MKIEKINDNQIRCTLTREDLAKRELKISELVYGSEKAKNLFKDMMQQANYEFGFEADDIPLMIEAIPISAESIVLIITKVEDPEELNPRLARFAPSATEDDEDTDGTDEIMDLFHRIQEASEDSPVEPEESDSDIVITPVENSGAPEPVSPDTSTDNPLLSRAFLFPDLQTLMDVAKLTAPFYRGESSLYKLGDPKGYLLIVTIGNVSKVHFSKLCNILSEYGQLRRDFSSSKAFLDEHNLPLLKHNALQCLCI